MQSSTSDSWGLDHDVVTSEYYTPAGTLYAPASGSWAPLPSAGNYCFTDNPLAIAGNQPASLPGTWTARVKINGAVATNVTFTIGSPSAGAQSTIYLMTRTKPTVCDSSNPPLGTTSFLTTDAQAFLFFIVNGVQVGDVASTEYYSPSGQLYAPASDLHALDTERGVCFTDSLQMLEPRWQ